MRCPFCSHGETAVRDSRPAEDGASVRRRRECTCCGARFTTYERVQVRDLTVVKRGGRKTPFDRDKLERSVRIAARKRPLGGDEIRQLVSTIVGDLERSGESGIDSQRIGERVMRALREADPVAYVRYASVYRDFRDPSDFARFIQDLEPAAPDRT